MNRREDPTRCRASEARDDHEQDRLSDAPPATLVIPVPIPQTANEVADAIVEAFPRRDRIELPPVLDVCCGPRSMWFEKYDSRAVFVDRREEEHEKPRKCRENVTRIEIKPDVLADFTALPFKDETFWHVVMDPPHYTERTAGQGHILKHYGCLFPGWQEMLSEGFRECFRVLKPGGTFIFKWCEHEIPLRKILALTPHKPLYGHRTGSREKTHWVAFIKQNGGGQ